MRVSVITASNRPSHLEHAVANYQRQGWRDTELIFVANSPEFDLPAVQRRLRGIGPCRVISLDTTLAAALNTAIDECSGEVWAKFDDDDEYGPDYVGEAVRAIRLHGAALVGKRAIYAYLTASDSTILRTPGREHRWQASVAGATLVGHKERLAGHAFLSEMPTGEDTRYMQDFTAAGNKIWSTSRYGFMTVRRADPTTHTWQIDDAAFSRNSEVVSSGMDLQTTHCR